MPQIIKSRARPLSVAVPLSRSALQLLAGLGVGMLALALLFLPEIRAAVSVWNASTAYGHCYLVLPMALYLLWDRRETIAAMQARADPAWALLALPIGAAWFAAERLGIMEGRQLMAIASLQVLLLAVLGRNLFWSLSGPLLYLFFLVPFGAFLTPALQHFTARFTEIGLAVLGIPNYTDDLVIEIPAGTFFVAEACAGLRFLIAAVAFGVFYALLNYRSPVRRAAFIAASVIVPIIANGFRALGIVVLGHVLGSAEAAAADHVVYGWVFFSFVMLLLVAAGMPLRETPLKRPAPSIAGVRAGPSPLAAGLAVVAAVALGPAIAALLNAQAVAAPLASLPELQLPEGCSRVGASPSAPTVRASFKIRCDDVVFDVVLATYPARSTPSALTAERRRATGEIEAEDTNVSSFVSGGGQGDWTLVQTQDPFQNTALATWLRGQPAATGLAGRVAQARDSVFGGQHLVVLMTISARQPSRLSPAQQQRLIAALRKLVEAQTGLTAQVEALARM